MTCLAGMIVGLGAMGSLHLRVLRAMEGVRLAAVVDPDPGRRERALRGDPSCTAFCSVEEALDHETPQFACIASPAPLLPGLARQFLERDVPVLIEKPLARDENDAAAIVSLAEERGVPLAVGHVERFNPAVVALKARLDEGALGAIYQIHARRLSPYPFREAGMGVALDLATHDIDVVRYLTGAEVERVYAEVAHRPAPDGGEVDRRPEDLVCASLRLTTGTTGLLEVNWVTPRKVREITVTGEHGTYVVDYLTQDLTFFANPRANISWDALNVVRGTGEGDMVRYALERREPLVVEWEDVLSAIREGRAPTVRGHDGLAALSTARAMQRAGREHAPVVPAYRAGAETADLRPTPPA
jgi:UDP-N-acetylglucosamine 3-dehydrogenase